MRKTIKFLFFAATYIVAAMSSFAQTADVVEGCLPLKVNFTAPAGNSTYYWNFKDGATSNLEKPSNIFTKGGTYAVTLQASPAGPIIGTVEIKVYDAPELAIEVPAGCAPLNAQFKNITKLNPAIQVNNYVWVWGDGSSSSGLIPNTSHTYPNVGKYSVSFSIETQYSSCNLTKIFGDVVEVLNPPTALFATTPAPATTCKDTINVSFINQSTGAKPLTYSWNMANGKTYTSTNPPSQQYIKGQFTPVLTTSYTGIAGCSSSYSVGVSAGSPKAAITLQNKDTVCINTATGFKTKSPGLYTWDFGPGASASSTNLDTVTVVFTTPGIHQISLKVTSYDGQCSATTTSKVYVDEVTASILGRIPFICRPTTITYTPVTNQPNNVTYAWGNSPYWQFDTTKIFKAKIEGYSQDNYFDINKEEYYMTALRVTSLLTGCKADALIGYDTLSIPNAWIKADKYRGCTPLKVQFSDSSSSSRSNPIVQRTWVFGDGTPSVVATDKSPVSHTYTTPGIYKAMLIVTTLKGCADTSFAAVIEVGEDLSSKINFISDKNSVCPGEKLTFSTQISPETSALIGAYHFSTEGNRTFHCSGQKSLTWSYNNLAGPQDVALTVDYNGCLTTLTKPAFITVNGAIAKIDYKAECKSPLLYNYTSKSLNATSLNWNFGDGQTSVNAAEAHTYASTGDYRVILEAQGAGCAPTKDTAIVHVRQVKAVFDIDKDGLVCSAKPHSFDASASIDVEASCFSGYTWEFPTLSDKRPYTSASSKTDFNFKASGKNDVRLIVKDINGCKDTAMAKFKVYDMKMDIRSDKSNICIPSDVQFTDNTISDTTVVSWSWDFGDNSLFSAAKSPDHKYTVAPADNASYPVRFRITDILGCVEDSMLILTYYKPTTSISVSKPYHCYGDSITIEASDYTSGGSSLSYDWDFGDGLVSTDRVNKIVYNNVGDYPITLNYKEVSTGCAGTTTSYASLQSYPKAYIQTDIDKSLKYLCADKNITFTDSTQTAFPLVQNWWDFQNGIPPFDGMKYALFYPKGSFTTTHIVSTSYGCKDTATVTYNIVRPEGNFDIDKSLICKGESIAFTLRDTTKVSSFSWIYGDGIIDENIAPANHQYNFHPAGGKTKATLLLKGYEDMCPWAVDKYIDIRQVIADFSRENGGDTSICFSQGAYHLSNTSSGYSSYAWDFGDGTTSTTDMDVERVYQPGIYNVQMSVADNQANCVDTIVKKVIVYANPVIKVAPDTVCQGNPLHMKVINPYSSFQYLWTPATGLSSDTSRAPIANILNTSEYNVMVTDTNSCMDTTQVVGIVIEPLRVSDWDTTIVIGDKAILPVYAPQNVYKFNWTPTEGLSCLNCYYPSAQPLEDITYKLDVRDVRNCFTASADYKITVRPETFVKMPTVFTPNGDGNNDKVYVKGWGIKELVNFSVFNRWGQLLYSSDDIDAGWDGKFNGEYQNNDVYVYKIKVKTWREEEVQKEGYINLLR